MTMSSSTTSGRSSMILSSSLSPSMYDSTWCPAALKIDSITCSSEYASSTTITLPIPKPYLLWAHDDGRVRMGGGCATDLPSRTPLGAARYLKKNACPRRGRVASRGSRDNFAPAPDTLASEGEDVRPRV